MIPLYLIKIVAPLITGVIALIAGIVELRLNPKNWLNRWFFSFFFSASLAHLVYSVYHLGIFNPMMISVAAVITQIFFNLIPISLVMTVFVLEKFPKVAMSVKYLGPLLVIFIVMCLGYFFFPPRTNLVDYGNNIVNTETELSWFIIVNILRLVLYGYALFKYAMIIKKTEDEAKQRIRWFFIGILISLIGIIFNVLGGILNIWLIEITTLLLVNIGAIIIVKGFFI